MATLEDTPFSDSVHQLLNHSQLDAYFDRVSLPASKRQYSVTSLSEEAQLAYLTLLQKHHIVKIPWDNLGQHYTWHHRMRVQPHAAFARIVTDGLANNSAHGGYCMMTNTLFFTVAASLGFAAYQAGSRIWEGVKYGGWSHVVTLVRIGSARYMCDAGYGVRESVVPMPLEHGRESTQVAPSRLRLAYKAVGLHRDRSQKVWELQFAPGPDAEWTPLYCFVDAEFSPQDLDGMNMYPEQAPHSFFTHKVVAARMTTAAESGEEPGSPGEKELEGEVDGTVWIAGEDLKWWRAGKTVLRVHFENEQQRVAALERYFGVRFDEEQRTAILGTAAEVGSRVPI